MPAAAWCQRARRPSWLRRTCCARSTQMPRSSDRSVFSFSSPVKVWGLTGFFLPFQPGGVCRMAEGRRPRSWSGRGFRLSARKALDEQQREASRRRRGLLKADTGRASRMTVRSAGGRLARREARRGLAPQATFGLDLLDLIGYHCVQAHTFMNDGSTPSLPAQFTPPWSSHAHD